MRSGQQQESGCWAGGAGCIACGRQPAHSADYARADSGRSIRVALYADIGSKYKSTVPLVTLQSEQSFSLLPAAGGSPLLSVPAQNKVRVSLDGFRVKVLETPSWQSAADAAKKLQSSSISRRSSWLPEAAPRYISYIPEAMPVRVQPITG